MSVPEFSIQGLTRNALRRLAVQAGASKIDQYCYEELRGHTRSFVEYALRRVALRVQFERRKSITVEHMQADTRGLPVNRDRPQFERTPFARFAKDVLLQIPLVGASTLRLSQAAAEHLQAVTEAVLLDLLQRTVAAQPSNEKIMMPRHIMAASRTRHDQDRWYA